MDIPEHGVKATNFQQSYQLRLAVYISARQTGLARSVLRQDTGFWSGLCELMWRGSAGKNS